jgi:uncharacterized protein YjdB
MRVFPLAAALLTIAAACGAPASPSQPLSVTPASVKLFAGDTTRLRTADMASVVRWHSAVPAIASVDRAGLVTALTPGLAAVWAVRGSDSVVASVEVIGVKCLLPMVMAPNNATLAPGDTIHVDARAGCVSPFAGFTWSSADTSVAFVAADLSNAGRSAVVTARRAGQVTIAAGLLNDPTVNATMAVTVRAP